MKFPYLEEAGDGDKGGGGGGNNVDIGVARTFLTDFVADPKTLETMPEPEIVSHYERYNNAVKKHAPVNDKWRENFAGNDPKKLERVARYASPNDALNALIAAQNKISEAGLKEPFPAKGTPEEQTAWRASNGIPEAPDKYDLNFKNGLVIGEEDKPRTESFLKVAHALNLNSDTAKAMIAWSYENQKQEAEAMAEADKTLAEATQDALRTEWGNDYKANMNLIYGVLDLSGNPELKQNVLGARMADGTPLMGNPASLKWLAQLAREINPVSTLVNAPGGDIGTALADEIAAIEKQMKYRKSDYYKGPTLTKNGRTDTKLAHRYYDLIEARDKQTRKAS